MASSTSCEIVLTLLIFSLASATFSSISKIVFSLVIFDVISSIYPFIKDDVIDKINNYYEVKYNESYDDLILLIDLINSLL